MTLESPADGETRIDIGVVLAAVWARKLRIILVTLLLLAATYAILLFVPKMYESSAGILVEPRTSAYTDATTIQQQAATTTGLAPGVVSSQMELLKSRDTLLRVIDSEGLRDVPEFNGSAGGPFDAVLRLIGRSPAPKNVEETVLNNLLERLTVIQERDSAIISVHVRSLDPDLAARLANAIAKAHVARRAELELSDTAEASVWLEEQIRGLTDRVAEAERKVADFRVANDLFQGQNNTSLIDQQLSNLATQITTATERQATAQNRAALIRELIEAGQPIDGVADVRDSVVIQQMVQNRATLQGERAQKSATLLSNHPTIRALDAEIAELSRQINNEAARVADALESQARIEAETVASLQAEMVSLKATAGTAETESVELDQLEREAKAQRDLLESYLLRYRDAVSRTNASSAFPDVRFITEAAPSVSPASPKTMFILVAVGFVALALQIGAIIFSELLSGRALRPRYIPLSSREPAMTMAPEPVLGGAVENEPVPEESEPEYMPEPEPVSELPPAHVPEPEPEYLPEPEPELVAELEPVAEAELEPELDLQPPEPEREPQLALDEPVNENEPGPDLDNLVADVALGRVQVIMLASLGAPHEASDIAEIVVADAATKGLSVCYIDAGSGRVSNLLGLTDLAAEQASYGDVVHKSAHEGLAEVPWGTLPMLDRRSTKAAVLIDALTDIYEVVVVLTGRFGVASTLPMFTTLPARVVLVAPPTADNERLLAAEADAQALGFASVQVVDAVSRQAEVA